MSGFSNPKFSWILYKFAPRIFFFTSVDYCDLSISFPTFYINPNAYSVNLMRKTYFSGGYKKMSSLFADQ